MDYNKYIKYYNSLIWNLLFKNMLWSTSSDIVGSTENNKKICYNYLEEDIYGLNYGCFRFWAKRRCTGFRVMNTVRGI